MARVWQLDLLTRSERDVLLALADHAHDDGTSARPGVPYLEWKLGLGRSTINVALRGLEEKELIESAKKGGGRGRVTEYRLQLEKGTKKRPFTPGRNRPSDTGNRPESDPENVPNASRDQEPSIEPPEGTSSHEPSARARNPIWDVLVELYGEPRDRFRAHFGLVVKDLRALLIDEGIRDAEQAKEEVRRRKEALAGEWGAGKATKDALVKHWRLAGELADQGVRGGLSADAIFDQALEDERREDDGGTS